MNELLTSQPFVILTGAGASKALGKATTFDIYDSPEFQKRSAQRPFSILNYVRQYLEKKSGEEPVDLEVLLDAMLELNKEFDHLVQAPEYEAIASSANVREAYGAAYELALDFLVDYYGNVDEEKAVALYEPFFDGLRAVLAGHKTSNDIVSLFTINYDEAIESAIDSMSRYDLKDGFGSGHRRFWAEDNFNRIRPTRKAKIALFKLHGSVSWTRSNPSARIEKTPDVPRGRQGKEHVILYPTQGRKGTEQKPFSVAYQYFESAFDRARLAVLIGTSFRDAEIRDVIRRRFQGRGPIPLIVVNPHALRRDVAKTIGIPQTHIFATRLSFGPAYISQVINEINLGLDRAL